MMNAAAINRRPIQKITADAILTTMDDVVVEEPLEIRLQFQSGSVIQDQPVSITMRTPGHDAELALGFLYTEGIIPGPAAICSVNTDGRSVRVMLSEGCIPDLGRLQRHFYTSSSCGVCGKTSIDSLRTVCPASPETAGWDVGVEIIYSLPVQLRRQQEIFQTTGGLHAAALFDRHGRFITLQEDIGRHNALDKLIGYTLQKDELPLSDHILLLSGRACYELIQKAAMAGIRMVAAVSAPSSLAIELAEEYGITLIGFLREGRFNVYSRADRISNKTISAHE